MISNKSLPMPITVKPYQHQAFDFACMKFGLITSDFGSNSVTLLRKMGTGKMSTFIGIIGNLYRLGRCNRILVVAPLSILECGRRNLKNSLPTRWMQVDKWDGCAFHVNEEELIGRTCYGGLELSSTRHLNLCFRQEMMKKNTSFYNSAGMEDNMRLRVRRDNVPWDVWAVEGCLETTEGRSFIIVL